MQDGSATASGTDRSTDTDSAQKKRKRDKEQCTSSKDASQQQDKFAMEVEERMNCVVCFSLPEKEVFQCGHGHLLCHECHWRLIDLEQTKCPTCRSRLSTRNPIRNIVAEETIGSLRLPCPNTKCGMILKRSGLVEHLKHNCKERIVKCKFARLGCEWQGPARKLGGHDKKCDFRAMQGSAIMEVLEANDSKSKVVDIKTKVQHQKDEVLKLLSARCRELVVRDVKLGRDDCHNPDCKSSHFSSGIFKAFGRHFTVHLNSIVNEAHRENGTVGYQLAQDRHTERASKKQNVSVFVIAGPSLGLDLPPTSFKHTFTKKRGDSTTPHIKIPCASEELRKALVGRETIHIRLALADMGPGCASNFAAGKFSPPPSFNDLSMSEDDGPGSDFENDAVDYLFNSSEEEDAADLLSTEAVSSEGDDDDDDDDSD